MSVECRVSSVEMAGADDCSCHLSPVTRHARRVEAKRRRAFTLVELLVVLAIMGIIAALAVPAFKNFGQSDAMTAADQQMLNDIARARQLAMSDRTTVYMVFVPTNFWENLTSGLGSLTPAQLTAATNLCGEQLTGYTFMSYGNVGDQPGQHQWHYLAPWQTLPAGAFIAQQKFDWPNQFFYIPHWDADYHNNFATRIYGFDTNNVYAGSVGFPIPTADSTNVLMPYIAFNYLGQLTDDGVNMANAHEYIPLARGSVLPAIDPNSKAYLLTTGPGGSPSVAENPPGNSTNSYNIIDIDPLTGRATLDTPRVQ